MSAKSKKIPFDLEKVKENLPKYSVEKLCDMVVCDRYFGFDDSIQVMCMEELAKRREAGDTFDFESYIEKSFKELPVISTGIPNIRDILNTVMKTRTGR